MHRVAFSVDDIDEALEIAARHGCHPLRGVATYEGTVALSDPAADSPQILRPEAVKPSRNALLSALFDPP
jgi:hypothetical protein